jgi:hypothetical protein
MLTEVAGDRDEAIEMIEGVLAPFREDGYRPALAWAAYDCARFRLDRGGNGDRDRATARVSQRDRSAPTPEPLRPPAAHISAHR